MSRQTTVLFAPASALKICTEPQWRGRLFARVHYLKYQTSRSEHEHGADTRLVHVLICLADCLTLVTSLCTESCPLCAHMYGCRERTICIKILANQCKYVITSYLYQVHLHGKVRLPSRWNPSSIRRIVTTCCSTMIRCQ